MTRHRARIARPLELQVIVRHDPSPAATGLVEVLRELLERWRRAGFLGGNARADALRLDASQSQRISASLKEMRATEERTTSGWVLT